MIEGLDILIFGQEFLFKLLNLRLGLLSADNGVVGLEAELRQSLMAQRVRSVSRLRWCTRARTSLILSMG
jgi:hypothetical protein